MQWFLTPSGRDPDALEAVERLRADLDGAAADAGSIPTYRALLVELFESFEIVQGDADAPETIEDLPMPTFVYKHPPMRGGLGSAEHRYYLLSNVRPDLAEQYNGVPLVSAPNIRTTASDSPTGQAVPFYPTRPTSLGLLALARSPGLRR